MQALLLGVLMATSVLYCTNSINPFSLPQNANVSLLLRDSKGLSGSNFAVGDTVGNAVRVGVVPFLSKLIDSVTVTLGNYTTGADTVMVIKNFSSDIDTQWFSFTFASVKQCTVLVRAGIQGNRVDSVSGVITIYGKTVTPAIHPLADTSAVDSLATFSVVSTGDAPFTYQWFHGANQLIGQTDVSLVLSHVTAEDSGAYTCLVTDKWGDTATAGPARLVIAGQTVVNGNAKPVLSVNGHSQILSTEVCSLTVSADQMIAVRLG